MVLLFLLYQNSRQKQLWEEVVCFGSQYGGIQSSRGQEDSWSRCNQSGSQEQGRDAGAGFLHLIQCRTPVRGVVPPTFMLDDRPP